MATATAECSVQHPQDGAGEGSGLALESVADSWSQLDLLEPKLGFARAIDVAMSYVDLISEVDAEFRDLQKTANQPGEPGTVVKALRAAGALGQLWKAPELGIPQKPSTLGQLLVLGTLGGLGGYGVGKILDRIAPNRAIRFSRAGALAGSLLGATPGLSGAALNHYAGRPVWTSSFWDWPTKTSSAPINADRFVEMVFRDPSMAARLPTDIQAAAVGLVTGAANLPGKERSSPFVTPFDMARMTLGMGTGAASGWLVGKALGTAFGTDASLQKRLLQTGALAGIVKSLIPIAYGQR